MSKLLGADGFNSYYKDIYGDRWDTLRESLLEESKHLGWKHSVDSKEYFLDEASVLVAYSLPLDTAKNILDMCAAPGGKSLLLAHRMNQDCRLLCNERSASRRNRLFSVLDEHLPSDIRDRINIASNDGSIMCKKEQEVFDAILLDAPCSSERHVLCDKKYLDQWTSARIKNLAVAQWALLSSAYRLLKPGGYLVYSTCALSILENDGVIKKLLKKFDSATIKEVNFEKIYAECSYVLPNVENTEYGYHVLPDAQNGKGPMFFTVIFKDSQDFIN